MHEGGIRVSDSVGKISLDLEIQSDISKQISSVSNAIAGNLKKILYFLLEMLILLY